MPVTLTAALCPIPPTPSALVDPAAGIPITSRNYVIGDSSLLLTKLNQNATREDLAGRWGGGGYAVVKGLDISAGAGLSLTVAAGQAMLDGPVTLPSGGAISLTDAITRAYIWLSQLGALVKVNNSLTPPAGAYCFLGSAVTAGGVITSVDQSGILYLRGGTLFRNTADSSCPIDTPPASLQYLVQGAAGAWWWSGLKYILVNGGRAALTYGSDADKTLTTPEATNSLLDFGSGGTTLTATRKAILPLEAGRAWDVRNQSPGAQSIQFIGASGTGVTVATGKAARIAGDGTSIFRMSADV